MANSGSNWEFGESKEYVIAKPACGLVVAISKGFYLRSCWVFHFFGGDCEPVCPLARNDSVYKQLHKLKFEVICILYWKKFDRWGMIERI